ncbi:shikimate dehydrogenase [Campylobacter sp. MIT 99-7217]|uniref:shikimate dehydrogenase n=1 Tax=Campylobacter sp. MIT 99-7217 TaxID=535091 RepID=UPI00115A9A37|nr:shikimate dehydrogenase [Campylobacter sp. MIT 99-7217]TQR33088.1 shikimate dehydrogenase [Campylobacter sp. MIT 99-7217]
MKFFAVIGSPIVHSKSPRMHNNTIQNLKLNAIYSRFELKEASMLKQTLYDLSLSGANITLPYKEEAFKIADFKDEFVLNTGSANTLVINEQKIYAYNTDGLGFLKAIEEFKDIKKALILGAGGTAKALAYALYKNNIEVSIANRSEKRFKDFTIYECFTYKNLQKKDFDLVINTTSAGLKDEQMPCERELLDELLSKAKYAFEVIYGKQTPFISLCKEKNLPYKDGLTMLLWQGIFAFYLFFPQSKEKRIYDFMLEGLKL